MADSTILMPGADETYRQSRDRLRAAEIDLRDRIEEVAAMRRRLPPGPVIPNYEFIENDNRVRLSDLFAPDKPYLILYHVMYWPKGPNPGVPGEANDHFCPMCSMWIDCINSVAPHVTQRVNLVVASRAPFDRLQAWGKHRGWQRVRLLSDDGPDFARDIGAEDDAGDPDSTVVVLAKDGDRVRHAYTAHPMLEDRERGIDLLCATWNLFDLTPAGRGEWYPSNDSFDAAIIACR